MFSATSRSKWRSRASNARGSVSGARSSLAPVRTMFTAYWIVILAGIVIYLVVGVTHN